jgi:3-oxoacyl-[acyl-carrier protein] reductase
MNNKNILVVGADGGIGSSVVNQLLSDGFSVIGTYFKSTIQIDKLRDNKSFVSYEVDISDFDSVKRLRDFVGDKELYAVINCSGIFDYEGESLDKDIEIWNEIIGVNLSGNYYLAKSLGSKICKNGRFVMISSTDSFYGSAISAAYAASKAGVNSLSKSLCLLFKDQMIRVNTIAPGWVLTPMTEGIGKNFLNKVADINPLKRNADPSDIANVVSFLISEKADYINGQVISVEGGYTNQDPTLMIEEDNT